MEEIIYIITGFIIIGLIFLLPLIPSNIAKNKGYSKVGFYIFGFFFFIIALIVSLCIENKNILKDIIEIESDNINRNEILDELKEYKSLLDNKAITKEEYEIIKKKLLDLI